MQIVAHRHQLQLLLLEPSVLTGSITSKTNVSVFGGTDGSVTVTGSGGAGTYQYSLDGGTYQATGTFIIFGCWFIYRNNSGC